MSQQINLIEPSLLPRREWLHGRSIAVIALLGTVLVSVHGGMVYHALRTLQAQNATVPPAPDSPASDATDELSQVVAAEQGRVARNERLMAAVASLRDLPRDCAQRLSVLVAALPETAWLQEVEFSGANGIHIVGGSTQADTLGGLAQQLHASQAFSGLPLQVFAFHPSTEPSVRSGSELGVASSRRVPIRYGFVLSSRTAEASAGAAGGGS